MSALTQYKSTPHSTTAPTTTTTVQHQHSNKRLYHMPAITNKSIAYLYMRQKLLHSVQLNTDSDLLILKNYLPKFCALIIYTYFMYLFI